MFNWIKKVLSRKQETPQNSDSIIDAEELQESLTNSLNDYEDLYGEYYVEIPDVPYSDGWVNKYDPVDSVNGYEEDWTYG